MFENRKQLLQQHRGAHDKPRNNIPFTNLKQNNNLFIYYTFLKAIHNYNVFHVFHVLRRLVL